VRKAFKVPVYSSLLNLFMAKASPTQALIGLCLALISLSGSCDDFPSRPITVIVPFNAGGGSDIFTRIFQKAIRENNLSPHPLVVENQGGAGGTIGSRITKDAPPDGHIIMCLHDGIYTAQHYGNADWGPDDFEPIAATGRSGVVIAVAEDSEYISLAALMAEAKERPYELVFGTNLGAPNHYSALFVQNGKPGSKFRFTQTGGGSNRLNQLIGGHVDVTGFSVAEYAQYKEAGIRALAVLSEEREPALPDLPTALEQGVDATHSLMQFWWAPKGTPRERVDYIADVLGQAMKTPYVQERLSYLQIEPIFLTGEALKAKVTERGDRLNAITIETTPPLPPLHWIILSLTIIFTVWVWREDNHKETV
tara:strand:- start:1529 stop:2626 length:1098 start_codon:yes stop_codon:yes gene_type:complete